MPAAVRIEFTLALVLPEDNDTMKAAHYQRYRSREPQQMLHRWPRGEGEGEGEGQGQGEGEGQGEKGEAEPEPEPAPAPEPPPSEPPAWPARPAAAEASNNC